MYEAEAEAEEARHLLAPGGGRVLPPEAVRCGHTRRRKTSSPCPVEVADAPGGKEAHVAKVTGSSLLMHPPPPSPPPSAPPPAPPAVGGGGTDGGGGGGGCAPAVSPPLLPRTL